MKTDSSDGRLDMGQDLYNRAKEIVKKDACMKFYDVARPLYLETDVSGVSHEPDYYRQEMACIAGVTKYQTMQQ